MTSKASGILAVDTGSAQHSFSEDERIGFSDYINSVLDRDADLHKHGLIPIDPNTNDLFEKCKNGILLCKLINHAVPNTIDVRAINIKLPGPNAFQVTENNNLAVNSAKAIGCSVVNIGDSDLREGRIHLILGVIWQIIRIGLLAQINLKNHPYLVRLLEPGETLEDFLKLPPDQILLRWFNYHLREAGHPRRVANFTSDIKDSENYTVLLSQIAPKHCNRDALAQSDPMNRAELVLQNADKIHCRKFLRPGDIVKANAKLNLAFVANLFNTWPGLEPPEEIPVVIDDETREEKAFRMWINSLGVDPYVNHLYDDLDDGLIILQVFDAIQPGIVDWSKVNRKAPLNKFKKVENGNYAVVLGKQLKFSLVGIAGSDIVDRNRKLMLAVIWQQMRYYVINFIKTQFGGRDVTENDIINWANDKVRGIGRSSGPISDFKDRAMSSGVYLLDLLTACKEESVDQTLIAAEGSEDDARLNAQYAISCARKMGCTVFCLWEDIVEVKPKMMLTFLGAVMAVFP